MANRFWVGGNSTWDATAGSKWATTSGGAGGSAVPTASDDVFLDNGTGHGNVTISAAAVCRSLNLTGYTGLLTMSANLTIGGTTAPSNAALVAPSSGWTFSWTAGTISYVATTATVQTWQTGGILSSTSMNLTVQTNGGTVQFLDSASYGAFNHSQGKVDFNGKNQTFANIFQSTSGNTRNLTLGSAVITLTRTGATALTLSTNGTPTWSMASGTFKFTGNAPTIDVQNVATIGTIEIDCTTATTSIAAIISSLTCTNLKFIGSSTGTQNQINLTAGITLTCAGTFTSTGSDTGHRVWVTTTVVNSTATLALSGATLAVTNTEFMDITVTGLTLTGTFIGDCGGNSGITADSPRTVYWVGHTGSASATTSWASSSGGGSGSNPPLPQDTAVFDGNSFNAGAQTATIDVGRFGSLTVSSPSNTPTIAISSGLALFHLFGSISWAGTWTYTSNSIGWHWRGRSSFTINTGGKSMATTPLTLNCPGGTYTLAANLLTTSTFVFLAGTFATSTFTMGNTGAVTSSGTLTRALNLGTGDWSVAGTGTGSWTNSGSGFTVTYSTGCILFSGASGTHAITSNGVSMPGLKVNTAGQTTQLADAYSTTAACTVTSGTLDFNGQTATLGSTFTTTGATTRVVTFGAAQVTVNGAITISGSGLTWTAGTSTLTWTPTTGALTATFSTVTLATLVVNLLASNLETIAGAFTAGTWTINGAYQAQLNMTASTTYTCTGTFTVTASSQNKRASIGSTANGTAYTISAATVSLTDVEFSDLTTAGAGTWSGTRVGGGYGGNTGLTTTTAQPQFKIASGSWSDVTKWSQSSGGPNNGRVPLSQDNVTIDGNSGGVLHTIDMIIGGKNLTVSGAGNQVTGASIPGIFLLFISGMTGDFSFSVAAGTSTTAISAVGRTTQNLSSTGGNQPAVSPAMINTTVKQLTDYVTLNGVGSSGGGTVYDMNGFNLTTIVIGLGFFSSDSFLAHGGVLTLTGTATVINTILANGGTMTLGTVNVTDSSSSTKIIACTSAGPTVTVTTMNFTGGGTLAFHATTFLGGEDSDDIVVSNFNMNAGLTLSLHHGQSTMSLGNVTIIGTPSTTTTINSTSAGTRGTSQVTGTVKTRYVTFKDAGFAGASAPITAWDGTDSGNNNNAIFRRSWVPRAVMVPK